MAEEDLFDAGAMMESFYDQASQVAEPMDATPVITTAAATRPVVSASQEDGDLLDLADALASQRVDSSPSFPATQKASVTATKIPPASVAKNGERDVSMNPGTPGSSLKPEVGDKHNDVDAERKAVAATMGEPVVNSGGILQIAKEKLGNNNKTNGATKTLTLDDVKKQAEDRLKKDPLIAEKTAGGIKKLPLPAPPPPAAAAAAAPPKKDEPKAAAPAKKKDEESDVVVEVKKVEAKKPAAAAAPTKEAEQPKAKPPASVVTKPKPAAPTATAKPIAETKKKPASAPASPPPPPPKKKSNPFAASEAHVEGDASEDEDENEMDKEAQAELDKSGFIVPDEEVIVEEKEEEEEEEENSEDESGGKAESGDEDDDEEEEEEDQEAGGEEDDEDDEEGGGDYRPSVKNGTAAEAAAIVSEGLRRRTAHRSSKAQAAQSIYVSNKRGAIKTPQTLAEMSILGHGEATEERGNAKEIKGPMLDAESRERYARDMKDFETGREAVVRLLLAYMSQDRSQALKKIDLYNALSKIHVTRQVDTYADLNSREREAANRYLMYFRPNADVEEAVFNTYLATKKNPPFDMVGEAVRYANFLCQEQGFNPELMQKVVDSGDLVFVIPEAGIPPKATCPVSGLEISTPKQAYLIYRVEHPAEDSTDCIASNIKLHPVRIRRADGTLADLVHAQVGSMLESLGVALHIRSMVRDHFYSWLVKEKGYQLIPTTAGSPVPEDLWVMPEHRLVDAQPAIDSNEERDVLLSEYMALPGPWVSVYISRELLKRAASTVMVGYVVPTDSSVEGTDEAVANE